MGPGLDSPRYLVGRLALKDLQGFPPLHGWRLGRWTRETELSLPHPCGLNADLLGQRSPVSVSGCLALARHQHSSSAGALAREVREGVEDADNDGVRGEDTD